jgi:hypothetical protein
VRRMRASALSGMVVASIAAGALIAGLLAVLALKSTSTVLHVGAPALVAGVAAWMFVSERYEVTLSVLALYLGLLDGFLKLKTGSTLASLGRDVLLYAIALGALLRLVLRGRRFHLPRYTIAVVAWVVVCVIEVLNPVVPSITHALAGTRQHVEFVPLFFLGYATMRGERRLRGLLVLIVVVAAINGIVALIQSRLSLTALAAWGPGYAKQVYGTSIMTGRTFSDANGVGHIRPPALGSDFGFGGIVGVLAVPAVLALGSTWAGPRRRGALIAAACAVLVVLAVATSQARSAVVAAVVAAVAYLLLTAATKKGRQTIAATAVLGLAVYLLFPAVFPSAASGPNRYASITPSKVLSTAVNYRSGTLSLVPHYMLVYPFGAGIGENGPAAGSSVGGSQLGANNAESEFNFLVLEVGVPGLLLLTWLTASVLVTGVRLRRLPDGGVQRALMALVAANAGIGALWFVGISTASSPTSPFFWFTAGAIVYWAEQCRRVSATRADAEPSGARHAGLGANAPAVAR